MHDDMKFLETVNLTPHMMGYICSNLLVVLASKAKNDRMFEIGVMSSPVMLEAVLQEAKESNNMSDEEIFRFVSFIPLFAKFLADFTEEENALMTLKVASCFNKYSNRKDRTDSPFAFKMSQEDFDKFFNINNERKEKDE